ncbi:hypothetical protein HY493_02730 [Candidatus Woesearchaeota archaeon]|nr:hypothetical protein [Candidatus Woesearchaeota archaeon]
MADDHPYKKLHEFTEKAAKIARIEDEAGSRLEFELGKSLYGMIDKQGDAKTKRIDFKDKGDKWGEDIYWTLVKGTLASKTLFKNADPSQLEELLSTKDGKELVENAVEQMYGIKKDEFIEDAKANGTLRVGMIKNYIGDFVDGFRDRNLKKTQKEVQTYLGTDADKWKQLNSYLKDVVKDNKTEPGVKKVMHELAKKGVILQEMANPNADLPLFMSIAGALPTWYTPKDLLAKDEELKKPKPKKIAMVPDDIMDVYSSAA